MMCFMRTLGALLAAAFLVVVPAAAASATTNPDVPGREITRWDETFVLNADGSADVRLEIDFDFGNDPGHGPYLLLPTRQGYDDNYDRVYKVSDISTSSTTGAPADANVTEDRYYTEVKVGDANIGNVSGVQTYVITYTVERVMNATAAAETGGAAAGDEFYWNAVGDQWVIPISNATVTVESPVGVADAQCFAGRTGVSDACTSAASSGTTATFTQDYLSAGQPFTVDVLYPAGSFETAPRLTEHSDVKRAFTLNVGTGVATAGILGVGIFVLTRRLRTTAVDEQYAGQIPGLVPVDGASGESVRRDYKAPVAVQFEPPPGMRPGQIGTLTDEKADPRDVTATLVDLAVRGYLRIDDLGEKKSGLFSKERDYQLVQLRQSDAGLFPYEAMLLDALFTGRTEVAMSDLKTTFASSMSFVQKQLYRNVTSLGWFRGNPQTARGSWAAAGLGLLIAGVMGTIWLAQGTRLALLPIPLILLGAITLATTRNAPARTAKGTAALQQARGFELYISKAEANQLRFEEGEDLFSKYLPYAIAFGVADKWAEKFEELARQGRSLAEPTWYGGYAYGTFWVYSAGLGSRMNNFASLADTAMSAPTPGSSGGSGFGGGGMSGGGGGGGGGGGW